MRVVRDPLYCWIAIRGGIEACIPATVRGRQEQGLAQALLDRLYKPMSLRRHEGIHVTDHPQYSEHYDP
jgi:hypothetical protein